MRQPPPGADDGADPVGLGPVGPIDGKGRRDDIAQHRRLAPVRHALAEGLLRPRPAGGGLGRCAAPKLDDLFGDGGRRLQGVEAHGGSPGLGGPATERHSPRRDKRRRRPANSGRQIANENASQLRRFVLALRRQAERGVAGCACCFGSEREDRSFELPFLALSGAAAGLTALARRRGAGAVAGRSSRRNPHRGRPIGRCPGHRCRRRLGFRRRGHRGAAADGRQDPTDPAGHAAIGERAAADSCSQAQGITRLQDALKKRARHHAERRRGRGARRYRQPARLLGLQRLLPRRHPRCGGLQPRHLRPAAGRGAEGAVRHPVRPRLDRRRDQPGLQGARPGAVRRSSPSRAAATTRSAASSTSTSR